MAVDSIDYQLGGLNTPSPSCLEFIRHGLPEGGDCYRGNGVDDPLSETGWQQMWLSMADDVAWDQVVSSPLRRCSEFAEAFCQRHELKFRVEPDLREIGFGDWEGKTQQQLLKENERAFRAFYQDPVMNTPAGAESILDFRQRIAEVVDRLEQDFADKRVLIVSHAGVMRAVVGRVLRLPDHALFRLKIANAARITMIPGSPSQLLLK